MPKLTEPPLRFAPHWLDQLDGRTSVATDIRTRWRQFTDDLGGDTILSYQQLSLVERALWLEYWLRNQERLLAEGKDFDVGKWTQACNALQGLIAKLGLERSARDVPNLADYLKKRA